VLIFTYKILTRNPSELASRPITKSINTVVYTSTLTCQQLHTTIFYHIFGWKHNCAGKSGIHSPLKFQNRNSFSSPSKVSIFKVMFTLTSSSNWISIVATFTMTVVTPWRVLTQLTAVTRIVIDTFVYV
jgi:hypothetical protein